MQKQDAVAVRSTKAVYSQVSEVLTAREKDLSWPNTDCSCAVCPKMLKLS